MNVLNFRSLSDREAFIKITGAFLWLLILIAFAACCYFVFFQGAVYQEALRVSGWRLVIASAAFGIGFSALWRIRKRVIDRHLLDTYGEECCKTLRHPIIPAQEAQAAPRP